MKKLFSVLLACAVAGLLALTGCGGGTPSSSSAAAGVPNPVTEHDTLEEALAAVDFDALVPGYVPEGFAQSAVSTINGSLVEVAYSDGTGTVTYRTAPASQGTGDIGITGDYNQYAATQDLDAGGTTVTVKGDKDGEWKVAQWTVGDMMYALAFDPPVSSDEVTKIVESVK